MCVLSGVRNVFLGSKASKECVSMGSNLVSTLLPRSALSLLARYQIAQSKLESILENNRRLIKYPSMSVSRTSPTSSLLTIRLKFLGTRPKQPRSHTAYSPPERVISNTMSAYESMGGGLKLKGSSDGIKKYLCSTRLIAQDLNCRSTEKRRRNRTRRKLRQQEKKRKNGRRKGSLGKRRRS